MTGKVPSDNSVHCEERLTLALIQYRKNRINYRLLFAQPRHLVRRGWHRRMATFSAGQVFGYERWTANKYGTQSWSIAVCCAAVDRRVTRLPGIQPGADVWLHAPGKTQVKRVFSAIDAMKRVGLSPESVTEYRWRELHNCIVSSGDPASLVASWT
jgi:hypothetical protein